MVSGGLLLPMASVSEDKMGSLLVRIPVQNYLAVFASLAFLSVASGQVGVNKVVSVREPADNTTGSAASTEGRISSNGLIVTFSSLAGDLTADADLNGATAFDQSDVYVRDLSGGATKMVSHNSGNTGSGQRRSLGSAVTPDGAKAVYYTYSNNLTTHTIVCGLSTGKAIYSDLTATPVTNFLANVGAAGSQPSACDQEMFPSVTPNGQFVVFASPATNLGGTVYD
ncbi:MAG: hypothetical protein ACRD8O_19795, partial [Bryobacteraceae bacterium]